MSDSWDPMSSKLRWTPNDFQSGARDLMISIFSPDLVLNTVRSLRLGVESREKIEYYTKINMHTKPELNY